MNARADFPMLRLTSPNARTTVVAPYGFDLECEYEYDEGESPILWPTDFAHPGSPPNAALLSCKVNGAELMEMLSPTQIERIEEAILSQLEG